MVWPISAALIVTDILNPCDHEDADLLTQSATPVLATLVARARETDTLVVYVNDCWEDWSAGRHRIADNASPARHPSSCSR